MPALGLGGDKEKFLVKFFSKNLRGVEQSSTALKGLQGVLVPGGHRSGPTEAAAETAAPAFPYFQKKGGRMSPSWDSTKAVAPGLERGKGSSIEKSQVLCGFQNLTQGSRVPLVSLTLAPVFPHS